jgi:hypothetical protein
VDDESVRDLFVSYLESSGFRRIDDHRAVFVYRSPDRHIDVRFDSIDGNDIEILRWDRGSNVWRVSATYTTPIPHLLTIATANDRDV